MPRAGVARGVLFALVLSATPAFGESALPNGFAGIQVGMKWADIEGRFDFRPIDSTALEWDRYATRCGFRSLVLDAENGELIVTLNDHVVTDVTFVTALEPGTDILKVADLVIQSYGQPDRASMRNLFGQITIDKDEVNFVTLEYRDKQLVEFSISGRGLWEYRIKVRYEHYRWHENRTLRCARALEREAEKAVAGESTTQP